MVPSNNEEGEMNKIVSLESQGSLRTFMALTIFIAAVAISVAAYLQVYGLNRDLEAENHKTESYHKEVNRKIHETMAKEPKLEEMNLPNSAKPVADGVEQIVQQQPPKKQFAQPMHNLAHTTQPQPQQQQKSGASQPPQQQSVQEDKPAGRFAPQSEPAVNSLPPIKSQSVPMQHQPGSAQQLKSDPTPINDQKTVTLAPKPQETPQQKTVPQQKQTKQPQENPATTVKKHQKPTSSVKEQQKPVIPNQHAAKPIVQIQQQVQQKTEQQVQHQNPAGQKISRDPPIPQEKTRQVQQKPVAQQQQKKNPPQPQQKPGQQNAQLHLKPIVQSSQQQASQQKTPIIHDSQVHNQQQVKPAISAQPQSPQPNLAETPTQSTKAPIKPVVDTAETRK